MSSETTKIFYTRTSVGNRHWVTGHAYPENNGQRYDPPKVMDFEVDAVAVYCAPGPVFAEQTELEDEQDGVEVELHELHEPQIEQRTHLEEEEPNGLPPSRGGEYWSVHVATPPEGTDPRFNVAIESPIAVGSARYESLVGALEARLGRTGLMVLVH